jgi:hypothetical protein
MLSSDYCCHVAVRTCLSMHNRYKTAAISTILHYRNITAVVASLYKFFKQPVDFINVFQVLPQHVSANGCHLQGVVGALKATQAVSVLWAYTDYDPSSVASCGHNTDTARVASKALTTPLKMASICRNMLG